MFLSGRPDEAGKYILMDRNGLSAGHFFPQSVQRECDMDTV